MADPYYQSRYTFNPARTIVWQEIVRFLKPYIPAQATVVDLGSGYCDFINQVTVAKKYAVDTSVELPKYATSAVIQINSLAWELSEIPKTSVDVVHASNLLEHFTDDELAKTMAEVKRILKSGGRLILMQPNYRLAAKNYFDDPTHKKVFSDASLESFLLAHDFKIIFKRARFLPFSMKSKPNLLPNWLLALLVRVYLHLPFRPFAGQMLFVVEK